MNTLIVYHAPPMPSSETEPERLGQVAQPGVDAVSIAKSSSEALAHSLQKMQPGAPRLLVTSSSTRCLWASNELARNINVAATVDERLDDRKYDEQHVRDEAALRTWEHTGWVDPWARVGNSESVFDHHTRVTNFLRDFTFKERAVVIACVSGATTEHLYAALLGVPMQAMSTAYIDCDYGFAHVWQFERIQAGAPLAAVLRAANIDCGTIMERARPT